MDTVASLFCVYKVINHEVLTKLDVQMTTLIVLIIYGTTILDMVSREPCSHGITDKTP